eukprot:917934_1
MLHIVFYITNIWRSLCFTNRRIRVVPWVLPPVVVLPSVAVLRPSSISSYIFSKSSFSSSSAIITPSPGSRSFGPSSEYVISSSSSPPSISITLLSIAISS